MCREEVQARPKFKPESRSFTLPFPLLPSPLPLPYPSLLPPPFTSHSFQGMGFQEVTKSLIFTKLHEYFSKSWKTQLWMFFLFDETGCKRVFRCLDFSRNKSFGENRNPIFSNHFSPRGLEAHKSRSQLLYTSSNIPSLHPS